MARACIEHLETVEIESDRGEKAVPLPRAMGQPAQPRLPRLLRHRGLGRDPPGRAVVVADSGKASTVDAHRHRRRRSARGQGRRCRHLTLADEIDAARGDVLSPPDGAPRGRRPVRRPPDLDVRGRAACPAAPTCCGSAPRSCRPPSPPSSTSSTSTRWTSLAATHARPQRDRLLQSLHQRAGRLRPLSRHPRDRRLHPDRPLHQPDGGAGHDRFRACAAPPTSIATRLSVDKAARARLKHQRPAILWFTGLSGSGKSTIANLVERRLAAAGHHTMLLDGDNIRHGLNRDLGFTDADRVENIRRIGEVAKLFVEAGPIVICSFISPFRAERDMVRDTRGGRASSSRSSSTRRSRTASPAIPRASTPRRWPARSGTSPASTPPTSARRRPISSSRPARPRPIPPPTP